MRQFAVAFWAGLLSIGIALFFIFLSEEIKQDGWRAAIGLMYGAPAIIGITFSWLIRAVCQYIKSGEDA